MKIISKIIVYVAKFCALICGGIMLPGGIIFIGASMFYATFDHLFTGICFLMVSLSFFWLAGMFKIPFLDDEPTCVWTEEDEKNIREQLEGKVNT